MHRGRILGAHTLLGILLAGPVSAEAGTGAPDLSPPLVQRAGTSLPAGDGLLVRPLPLRLESVWNSTYPSGDDEDGLLWAGRGLSQLASGGVAFRWGPLSAAAQPEVAWSENRAFELRPTGRPGDLAFANPYYGDAIDLPQRFGAGPFAVASPGQSYVRLDLWNVAVGLSNENLRFGPGTRNAVLMSGAGPGFPHVFLGTSRPVDFGIGEVEAMLLWGRLTRTRFVSTPTHPLLTGLVVTWAPRWLEGLTVGLARVHLQVWSDLRLVEWFPMFESFARKDLEGLYPAGDNPEDNQIASVFGRWAFPEVGFEVHAEWGRDDNDRTFWGTIREPDHTQFYTLGLTKLLPAGGRTVRILAELTHLQELRPLANQRGVPVVYTHGNDLGYTNGGQMLGAWIGPGADSQTLAVDVFHPGGRIGGFVERVRRNDAYYWEVVEPQSSIAAHDVELSLGVRQVLTLRRAEVSWAVSGAYRQNRDFLRHERNLRLVLGVTVPLGR